MQGIFSSVICIRSLTPQQSCVACGRYAFPKRIALAKSRTLEGECGWEKNQTRAGLPEKRESRRSIDLHGGFAFQERRGVFRSSLIPFALEISLPSVMFDKGEVWTGQRRLHGPT